MSSQLSGRGPSVERDEAAEVESESVLLHECGRERVKMALEPKKKEKKKSAGK